MHISEILKREKKRIKRLIDEQGKLTEELKAEIEKAEVLQRVEDLYKPYKQKKATRASKAREKDLNRWRLRFLRRAKERQAKEAAAVISALAAPYITLADANIEDAKRVADENEAVKGACDIIAEMISDDAEMTALVREKRFQQALSLRKPLIPKNRRYTEMYYEYKEGISKIPNHRVLAINRGEKEKKLRVKLSAPAEDIIAAVAENVITDEKAAVYSLLMETIADAYKRLMAAGC